MGIRFACHHCNYSLHVKDFQGGKRGRCPECKGQFRIPNQDAAYSAELEESGNKSSDLSEAGTISYESDVLQSPSLEKTDASKGEVPNNNSISPFTTVTAPHSEMPRMPQILADSIGAKWFVRPPTGGQFGPATSQLLLDWIKERRVTSDSFLWKEGTADWELASQLLPELYPEAATKIPPSVMELEASTALFVGASSTSNDGSKPSSASGQLLAKKRAQKRKQQLAIVIVLGLASLALLATLIIVLVMQMNKA
jgi:hypothetical protein